MGVEGFLSSASESSTSLSEKRHYLSYLAILEQVWTGDLTAPTPIEAVFVSCCRTWFDGTMGINPPMQQAQSTWIDLDIEM